MAAGRLFPLDVLRAACRQSVGSADRICPPRKLPGTGEWVSEDEGYSGAHLIRPGPPRIRDLAAEGQIQAVLALSPDRVSRKYAYQVLLTEELARHGVDRVIIKAPHSGTPEDQLLLQFQGMIAETSERRFWNAQVWHTASGKTR